MKARIMRDIQDSHRQIDGLLEEIEQSRIRRMLSPSSTLAHVVTEKKRKVNGLFAELKQKESRLQHTTRAIITSMEKDVIRAKECST